MDAREFNFEDECPPDKGEKVQAKGHVQHVLKDEDSLNKDKPAEDDVE